jgi:hypothetical protein
MKQVGMDMKINFDVETDNTNGICGSAPNVNELGKAFSQYKEEVLSGHEMASFVVKKELSMHPAVPEFQFNAAECRVFMDELGSVNKCADFPSVNPHGGLGGPKGYLPWNIAGAHNKPVEDNKLVKIGGGDIAQLKAQAEVISNAALTQMYQQQMPA